MRLGGESRNLCNFISDSSFEFLHELSSRNVDDIRKVEVKTYEKELEGKREGIIWGIKVLVDDEELSDIVVTENQFLVGGLYSELRIRSMVDVLDSLANFVKGALNLTLCMKDVFDIEVRVVNGVRVDVEKIKCLCDKELERKRAILNRQLNK